MGRSELPKHFSKSVGPNFLGTGRYYFCSALSLYCYLLDQFSLGRLNAFVGSFSPVDSPRLWFLLVDSSFQVSTSVRVKQDVFTVFLLMLKIPPVVTQFASSLQ